MQKTEEKLFNSQNRDYFKNKRKIIEKTEKANTQKTKKKLLRRQKKMGAKDWRCIIEKTEEIYHKRPKKHFCKDKRIIILRERR